MAAAQAGSDWSSTPAVGLGPLLLRSQSPLNLLQLTPTPLPPITVQRGQLDIGVLESWNNYFDVDPGGRYIIDAETLGLTIGAGYGITDTLDVSVSLPVTYRGGGILDGFVEWFENGLGVPNKDRRRYPRNQFLVLLHGEDGKTYQFTGTASGWGLEDGTATARYQISRGSETTPAILAGFGVKLPTGRENSFHSSGGTDLEAVFPWASGSAGSTSMAPQASCNTRCRSSPGFACAGPSGRWRAPSNTAPHSGRRTSFRVS
jgi:hypothetical protein